MIANKDLEANFSTLLLSIASSAAMNMGLAPNPVNGKNEKNLSLAKFNIELIRILEQKTKGNLSKEEEDFIKQILSDLQIQFINANK